jgi:choline-glycine betaine transporter
MTDKTLLYICTALTTLCGLLMSAIALWGPAQLGPQMATAFDVLKWGFMVGLCTIFGLLNSRAPPKPDL